MTEYQIPGPYYFRLHHVRPRFKGQVEDVLIYMATEIANIGFKTKSDFDESLDLAIRLFPGNANLSPKTIANWRTEISSLFGFVARSGDTLGPTKLAERLAATGDLVSFFRTYLAKFQYPGGHVKPQYVAECIEHDIKFKPASFIIRVLLAGQALSSDGKFWIEKREATALIWNDLRVTQGSKTPQEVAAELIQHRGNSTNFSNHGDVTRYAGDILDYMVLANVLYFHPSGRYHLSLGVQDGANLILSAPDFFSGYDPLYKMMDLSVHLMKSQEAAWFDYAGNQIDGLVLDTDPLELLEVFVGEVETNSIPNERQSDSANAHPPANVAIELLDFLRAKLGSGQAVTNKETGNLGEFLVLRHEHNRLKSIGADDQAKRVRKIPDYLGVGYDIKSYKDSTEAQKLIEVKTSISHGALRANQFHLTKNEWKAAEASGESYYVYRVLISTNSISCFVIHDPVDKFRAQTLSISINNGVDMVYKKEAGEWESLLIP